MKEKESPSRQSYVKGKGNVYCWGNGRKWFKCPRTSTGFTFPGKKKCKDCQHARFRATKEELK